MLRVPTVRRLSLVDGGRGGETDRGESEPTIFDTYRSLRRGPANDTAPKRTSWDKHLGQVVYYIGGARGKRSMEANETT